MKTPSTDKKRVRLGSARDIKEQLGWRNDEKVVALRKQLRKFAPESLEFCGEVREDVIKVQRLRVKAGRLLYTDVVSRGMDKLVETIAKDKAYRSRIVAQLVEVQDRLGFMQTSISLIRRHLKSRYASELRKEFGAITIQDDAIGDHFSSTVEAIKLAELVTKLADMVIVDIDKGSFADGKMKDIATLVFHPGRAD